MDQLGLFLKVAHTSQGSALPLDGRIVLQPAQAWMLGRSPDADAVLPDPSVSREHACVRFDADAAEPGWRVENRSSGNGVFLDGAAVASGAHARLPERAFTLQLGKVVLEVEWLQETRPHLEPIETDDDPVFEVVRDGDACTAYCKGQLMALKPSSALTFWALCRDPGRVQHHWDIQTVMGYEADLPQAISGLRRELRAMLDANTLSRGELVRAIVEVRAEFDADDLEALEDAALVRQLVFARRGHGYALAMPAHLVTAREAG